MQSFELHGSIRRHGQLAVRRHMTADKTTLRLRQCGIAACGHSRRRASIQPPCIMRPPATSAILTASSRSAFLLPRGDKRRKTKKPLRRRSGKMSRSAARRCKEPYGSSGGGRSLRISIGQSNRRPSMPQSSSRTYIPTFLRWHDPDQVRRDQGIRLISARMGAPSGFPGTTIPLEGNPCQRIRRTMLTKS